MRVGLARHFGRAEHALDGGLRVVEVAADGDDADVGALLQMCIRDRDNSE